jgi:hypothetical protein
VISPTNTTPKSLIIDQSLDKCGDTILQWNCSKLKQCCDLLHNKMFLGTSNIVHTLKFNSTLNSSKYLPQTLHHFLFFHQGWKCNNGWHSNAENECALTSEGRLVFSLNVLDYCCFPAYGLQYTFTEHITHSSVSSFPWMFCGKCVPTTNHADSRWRKR